MKYILLYGAIVFAYTFRQLPCPEKNFIPIKLDAFSFHLSPTAPYGSFPSFLFFSILEAPLEPLRDLLAWPLLTGNPTAFAASQPSASSGI